MKKITPPTKDIQEKALVRVVEAFKNYDSLLRWYRTLWLELFKSTYIFETERRSEGQSTIFFPKCYEQMEKIAPRLTGNDPKFIIGLNVPINPLDKDADMIKYAQANQATLNYFWKLGNSSAKLRSLAKGGLLYGIMFAKVGFHQKLIETKEVDESTSETGELTQKTVKKEEVLQEYPIFTVPDIFDVYFDPRIEFVDDMSSIIEVETKIRKSDIYGMKDTYFNLDEIKKLNLGVKNDDYKKTNKFSLQGVPTMDNKADDEYLSKKTYYGYFSETDDIEDEELYKITTINDSIVIGYEEIKFIPFEKFVPVEIPNQGVGKGIIEPIKKLQEAYNLTRNQRFENVSLVLNRMWLMKAGASIDPRKLVSRAGNIIMTKDMAALAPVPTPDVTNSAFSEAQSINTEIQTTLGTIDTTQDSSDNGFTNLATGQKIRWNEFNTRFKGMKKNLEETLERLGEKMLMIISERATQNPRIFDEKTQKFYEVAKTAFDSFSDFYSISVLADSTATDSIDNKREEVLAFGQLAIAYRAQGVPIDMSKVWMDIVESFPGKNPTEYIPPPPQPIAQPPVAATNNQMTQPKRPNILPAVTEETPITP